MPLILNEDQTLLKDSAKDFFTKSMPVKQLRQIRDDEVAVGYSTDSWKEIVDLGWSGITVEEEFGGLEFGYLGLGVILEEGGRTLAASPLFSTCVLGAAALTIAGSKEQKSELLPLLVQGELKLSLAIEEGAAHAPQRTRTTATKSGDGFSINGTKTFVLDASSANKMIVVARTSGEAGSTAGLTLFLVDADTAGISITSKKMADSRNACTVNFDNVAVPAANVLGQVDGAASDLQDILSIGQICISADMLGSAREVFERTVEYIKMREQFDTILGTKQALQHRAAQLYTEIELAKSVVIAGLTAIDEGQRGDALAKVASLTKSKVGETFTLSSSEGVQTHGGIGMTDDEEIGFFLKRARTTEHTLGDVRYHQNRYGDLLGL
ncbi:MAG: acyl-CoA/acyl-ACP dehydrogenase [Pseudomonadales bacterium]|nr:acyl-CoA/acyl-ACP dehydrogenase [Pseudomonadales bacterium]